MKFIRIAPRADLDIDECCGWLGRENPAVALKFLDAVMLTCQAVATMPGMGSPRYADVPLVFGVRMIKVRKFESYLIFYLERETTIDIIRVLHRARNIPEALQAPE